MKKTYMKYGFHIVCRQFISAGILLDGFIQLILRVLLQDLPAITVGIVGTFVVSQCLLFSQFTLVLLGQLLSRWQLFSFTALQHSWFPKEIITIANSNWNIFLNCITSLSSLYFDTNVDLLLIWGWRKIPVFLFIAILS